MTEPQSPTPAAAPLQFDKAVTKDGAPKGPGVSCSMCDKKILERYYTFGDQPTCLTCKMNVERDARHSKRFSAFMKASVYGFGASVAGALVYYAFLKFLHLQIGLVAIAIGFGVGYAMKKGTKGWGGRRYQLVAAGLTYLSVCMAYFPFAVEARMSDVKAALADSTAVADSADADDADADDAAADAAATVELQGTPVTGDSTTIAFAGDSTVVATDSTLSAADSAVAAVADSIRRATAEKEAPTAAGWVFGFLGVFLLALALPVLYIISSLPFGLISALIIGYGMKQAWTMTEASELRFDGPLTVVR